MEMQIYGAFLSLVLSSVNEERWVVLLHCCLQTSCGPEKMVDFCMIEVCWFRVFVFSVTVDFISSSLRWSETKNNR